MPWPVQAGLCTRSPAAASMHTLTTIMLWLGSHAPQHLVVHPLPSCCPVVQSAWWEDEGYPWLLTTIAQQHASLYFTSNTSHLLLRYIQQMLEGSCSKPKMSGYLAISNPAGCCERAWMAQHTGRVNCWTVCCQYNLQYLAAVHHNPSNDSTLQAQRPALPSSMNCLIIVP